MCGQGPAHPWFEATAARKFKPCLATSRLKLRTPMKPATREIRLEGSGTAITCAVSTPTNPSWPLPRSALRSGEGIASNGRNHPPATGRKKLLGSLIPSAVTQADRSP
jgi:hypothetical protein